MKHNWLRILVLTLFVMQALTLCSFAASAPAVLDNQILMTKSVQVKDLQEQLNAKGKEINQRLETDKPNLSEADFKQKQEEAFKEFVTFKAELEKQLNLNIDKAIEKVVKDKNLTIVFAKSAIVFGGQDITEDVIKVLDAK